MARFPLKEAEVVALAEAMITGLTDNAAGSTRREAQ